MIRPIKSAPHAKPQVKAPSRNSVYAQSPRASRSGGPWFGSIIDTDTERRVARFRTHGIEAIDGWAPWLAPYTHVEKPFEGDDFTPRPGAQCVIQEIQGTFVITGFYHSPTGADRGGASGGYVPNHAGVRPKDFDLGDRIIGTLFGNRLHLTADGAIILHSRSLARMILEPLKGLCRFFLRNWERWVEGGYETWWSQQDPEPRSDYVFLAKDDPRAGKDNRVTLEIGKNGDLYQLKGLKRTGPGEEDFDTTYRLHFDKDGNLTIEAAGNADVTIDGNATVHVKQNADVDIDGNATVDVGGSLDLESGGEMNFTAGGNMRLTAPRIDLN